MVHINDHAVRRKNIPRCDDFRGFIGLNRALAERDNFHEKSPRFTPSNRSAFSQLPRADGEEVLGVYAAGAISVGGGDERLAVADGEVVPERHAERDLYVFLTVF